MGTSFEHKQDPDHNHQEIFLGWASGKGSVPATGANIDSKILHTTQESGGTLYGITDLYM